MKRMWSYEELAKLIEELAPGFDPSSIESGNVPQDAVVGVNGDGELVKGDLFGKYVKIIEAPTSTTLTDGQYADIIGGTFINGTFLGVTNPAFMPAELSGTKYYGLCFGSTSTYRSALWLYEVNGETKVIRLGVNAVTPILWFQGGTIHIGDAGSNGTQIANLTKLNDKFIPNYPASTGTFTLKCVDGVLTWVSD